MFLVNILMMRNDLPILTKYLVTVLHPVIMILVIVGTFYAAYFGMQVRRTRNAEADKRNEMVKARYNQKHFQVASALLSAWVLGSILGMAATYYLYNQLFVSPHLIGGFGIIAFAAVAGSLSPWLQRGKKWARTMHIILAVLLVGFSISQVVTGFDIVRIVLDEISQG